MTEPPLPLPEPAKKKLTEKLTDQLVKPEPVEIVEAPPQPPPEPELKPKPQRESDQTLKLEGPVSS